MFRLYWFPVVSLEAFCIQCQVQVQQIHYLDAHSVCWVSENAVNMSVNKEMKINGVLFFLNMFCLKQEIKRNDIQETFICVSVEPQSEIQDSANWCLRTKD